MTVEEDVASVAAQFRGELLAYCYRMLGSIDEAEDLVQETYLRAWRSFGEFEGRASVRTWLQADRDQRVPDRARAPRQAAAACRSRRPGRGSGRDAGGRA